MSYTYNPETGRTQPFEVGDKVRTVGEAWDADPPFEEDMTVEVVEVTYEGYSWWVHVAHPVKKDIRTVLSWEECHCCTQWAEKIEEEG